MPNTTTVAEIGALLHKYQCPLSYHAVRTRILGSLARYDSVACPLSVILRFWDGAFPDLANFSQAHDVYQALGVTLWQELSKHRLSHEPFKSLEMSLTPLSTNLDVSGMVRVQEIEGFIAGIFDDGEETELPWPAFEAVTHLGDIRTTFFGLSKLMKRASETPGNIDKIAQIIKHMAILTSVMEVEIHATVLSCWASQKVVIAQPRLQQNEWWAWKEPSLLNVTDHGSLAVC